MHWQKWRLAAAIRHEPKRQLEREALSDDRPFLATISYSCTYVCATFRPIFVAVAGEIVSRLKPRELKSFAVQSRNVFASSPEMLKMLPFRLLKYAATCSRTLL